MVWYLMFPLLAVAALVFLLGLLAAPAVDIEIISINIQEISTLSSINSRCYIYIMLNIS